ncbi:MAG: TOTE conflict system archaeo-eukaryotic primase domain-containing protein [Actinomycetota bacterium]
MMAGIDEKKLDLFMSLFKGRPDVYAKRWQKGTKTGYMPAYSFDWDDYLRHKVQGGNFKNFTGKTKIPLTREVIRSHLAGTRFIGIYPLLKDNTSFFIAIDFDKKDWVSDSKKFLEQCGLWGIPAYIEKSLSGEGAHLWVFFAEKYPAAKSRRIFLEMARKALKLSEFSKEVSFDRIFPNQDYHSGKGFGNLIALPLNGKYVGAQRTVFLNPENFEPVGDQWRYLSKVKKVSAGHLDELYLKIAAKEVVIREDRGKNLPGKLEITVERQIVLPKQQIGKNLANYLKKNLNFINSEYIVKQKIGKSVYGVDKFFNLIKESKQAVMIPRGFMSQLKNFCDGEKIDYRIIDKRPKIENIEFRSKIRLNDLQEKVIQSCEKTRGGVIVAPPGFGKTVIGIELIARKRKPSLIIVHRRQIYEQWIERIQDFLGLNKKDIGQICANKKRPSEITVAMVQSLAKFSGLKDISESFGTIIIDECHHIPAKSFRKTIVNFNPCYIYGLTATPKRKYNDEKMIFFYIGDIICNTGEFAGGPDYLKKENIQLRVRDTALNVPFDNRTDDFQMLSRILVFDTQRNGIIVGDIQKELKPYNRILVLTERKEHVEVLGLYLKSLCEIITLTGDDSRAVRKLKMKQIGSGNFQVLITTGQLLGEGLDVCNLSCLFLVFPFAFEGKLIQYIGRILRTKEKKLIYDYRDKNIGFLEKLYKKRERYYRKSGLL